MPRLHRRSLLRALGKLPLADGTVLPPEGSPGRAAIVDESEGGADELVRVGSASRQPVGSWEFNDGGRFNSSWKPMGKEMQAAIEAAHATGEPEVTVAAGDWTYLVDFAAMKQTNTETRKTRPLRRVA